MSIKSSERVSQLPIQIFLIVFTILTLYPILWVFCIALSGEQSLAIAEVPSNPSPTRASTRAPCR